MYGEGIWLGLFYAQDFQNNTLSFLEYTNRFSTGYGVYTCELLRVSGGAIQKAGNMENYSRFGKTVFALSPLLALYAFCIRCTRCTLQCIVLLLACQAG